MDIDEFKRRFGLKVQSHRRRRQMTQEELADQVQRSTDTISNIERGVSSTRIETAFRIAEVLGVPVLDLFDVEDAPAERERRQLIESLLNLVEGEDGVKTLLRVKERATVGKPED